MLTHRAASRRVPGCIRARLTGCRSAGTPFKAAVCRCSTLTHSSVVLRLWPAAPARRAPLQQPVCVHCGVSAGCHRHRVPLPQAKPGPAVAVRIAEHWLARSQSVGNVHVHPSEVLTSPVRPCLRCCGGGELGDRLSTNLRVSVTGKARQPSALCVNHVQILSLQRDSDSVRHHIENLRQSMTVCGSLATELTANRAQRKSARKNLRPPIPSGLCKVARCVLSRGPQAPANGLPRGVRA